MLYYLLSISSCLSIIFIVAIAVVPETAQTHVNIQGWCCVYRNCKNVIRDYFRPRWGLGSRAASIKSQV